MKKLIFIAVALLSLECIYSQIPTLPQGEVMPDNIKTDVDCFTNPPAIPFTFNLLTESPSANVNAHTIPILGDIDNDGYTEIIVPTDFISGKGVSVNQLHIFEMKNNRLSLQQTLTTPYFNFVSCPFSIAKVDGNDYAAIFLSTDDINNPSTSDKRKLIKYVYNPATKLYEEFKVGGNLKRGTYSDYSKKEMAQPMITDFNGDSIPEVVTYDRVYNARTMELLADGKYLGKTDYSFGQGGHFNNNQTSELSPIMAIGDIDNDNIPEVIGGNCVYKVNITNPNGLSGNSLTLMVKCNQKGPSNEQHNEAVDGATSIADIDGDGYLDIIVTANPKYSSGGKKSGALYIWSPLSGKIMHTTIIDNLPVNYAPSVAFIGDVDNNDRKNQPEICITGQYITRAYTYDPQAKTLSQKWNIGTNDNSGATTLSLFDFDQDGNAELVYRDETNLRILNGKDGSDKIKPISCHSQTGIEYPLVADVNGDGAAEIIVTGDSRLKIYASNPVGSWAPARKVWNQFAYNVINVNEDLTIPKVQFRQTTKFAGADGIIDTSDDIRPYNAYLQQQTILNKNGVQLWLAANAQFANMPKYEYTKVNDKMKISFDITNIGDNPFRNFFYVTVYKDKIINSPKQSTYTYGNSINPDDTIKISFTLDNFSTDWNPNSGIIINLNDKGDGKQDQNVCGQASPIYYYPVIPTNQDDCSDFVDRNMTCPYAAVGSTFQWQLSKDRGITWSDITGATGREYTTNQRGGTVFYRVKVKLPNSVETTSEAVTFRMRSCQMPVNHNISVMGYQ